ncbi:MAG: DoxX family protein [bacterium]|nr:DoxX family protein [bacterium]
MSTVTTDARTDVIYQEDIVKSSGARMALAALRIVTGFYFLWAFLDKLFGLGFSTPGERAWINGGSPTAGYLAGATADDVNNPFKPLFEFFLGWGTLADIIFMAGLLGIGVAVLLGAGLKIAAIAGTLLVGFMWLSQFPLTRGGSNPILTSHWLESLAMIVSATTLAGDTWGVGKIWGRMVGNGWLR